MIYLSFQEYPVAEDLMLFCSDSQVAMETHYTLPPLRELEMKGCLLEEWHMQVQQIPFLEEERLVVSRQTRLSFYYDGAMAPERNLSELLKPDVEARQAHRNPQIPQIRHCRVPEEALEDLSRGLVRCLWEFGGNILLPILKQIDKSF